MTATMTPPEIAAVWNRLAEWGGAVIRWDEALGEYQTREGEAYSAADVEAVARGLIAQPDVSR